MQNILEHWSVTVEELSQAILENGSLRGMVFGYVAEIKLRELLEGHPDVSDLVKNDDHNRKKKGDLRILYRGHEFKIESKSLQTARNKQLADGTYAGVSQVDASDRRTVSLPDGTQLQTTNLVVGEFDVLAVNCFTFQNQWHFVFARNTDLPRSTFKSYSAAQREHLLATTVAVVWPAQGIFSADLFALLDEMIEQKNNQKTETIVIKEVGLPSQSVESPE